MFVYIKHNKCYMVNFEWYRTFKTIYECNSISEASKKLFITQPGVSKHLSALEAQIGKKLFIRTARKTLPTEYGKFLYTQVSASISELEKAENNFSKAGNKHCPSIVVGCSYDYFKNALLDKLPELDMFLTFHFGTNNELATSLENGKTHLTIGTEKYNTFPHTFSNLNTEKFVLIASNTLNIPKEISAKNAEPKEIQKWLSKQNWFAFDNELPFVNKFWEYHFKKRPQIKARIVFPSFTDVIKTMQKIDALCVMPLYACEGALAGRNVKYAIPNFEAFENKLYCANKPNSENLYEIRLLKEKLEFPL